MTVNAYDDLAVCNAAVTLIGERPINSIDDPVTDIENSCAVLFPLVRDSLLGNHDWNFAKPVRQLPVNADETAIGGYTKAFKLPSDLVAGPFAVYADGDLRRPVQDYIHANDHIHADYDRIDVSYRRNPPVSTMPVYFINLLATALAADLAKPVADNTALAEELNRKAFGSDGNGGLFAAAKRIDSFSEPVKSLFRNGDPLRSTRY